MCNIVWRGGLLCPFRGELGPRLTQCGLSRGLLPYQVVSSSIQPFGHNRHEPKIGGCAPFRGEQRNPIQHNVAWAVPSGILTHPAVWPQQTWPKNWVGVPFFLAVSGSPSNTKSPGPRPTSIPSAILVDPVVWPQRTLAENWGTVPL